MTKKPRADLRSFHLQTELIKTTSKHSHFTSDYSSIVDYSSVTMVEVDNTPLSSVGEETDVSIEAGGFAPGGAAPPADCGISSVGGESDVSIEAGGSAPGGGAPPADGGISSGVGGDEAGGSVPTIVDGGAPPADGGISSGVGGETDVSIEAGGFAPTKPRRNEHFSIVSYLQEHGYSLRTIVAMSHGLKKDDGTPMLDITSEPFASMPAKMVKALASDYHSEVSRRYSYSHEKDDPRPRPILWSITKCQEWLDRHPIDDGSELRDIATEIEKYRMVVEKAAAERGSNKERKKKSMLRMIHALVDRDEVKRAYLTRQRAYLTRQRQFVVGTIKKNKVMADVLTQQVAEIDKEILGAEMKMLLATPVRN